MLLLEAIGAEYNSPALLGLYGLAFLYAVLRSSVLVRVCSSWCFCCQLLNVIGKAVEWTAEVNLQNFKRLHLVLAAFCLKTKKHIQTVFCFSGAFSVLEREGT